jgi:Family of unknown function (DUF5808)
MARWLASNPIPRLGPPLWFFFAIIGFLVVAGLLPLLVPTREDTPDEFWRGMFYVNPEDPALLVRKRYGVGYTVNFGNPRSFAVVGFVVLMIALPLVFVALTVHQSFSHLHQISK